ncbi:MAG: sigma-70 family RNA polymerase sigma factor [Betaproteobacteria bacterium]
MKAAARALLSKGDKRIESQLTGSMEAQILKQPPGFADQDLITRVLLNDDRNAFGELVRRHQSQLRASLRRMTNGNLGLADDIAQETFILAWKNIKSFRYEARFSTWLYRIAFNAWQSEVRKKHEFQLDDALMPELEESGCQAESIGVRRDLAQAMAGLTVGEYNAIIQCYYNDLSHDEAAFVLSIPLGTVKTNILKAKEKMRAKLAAYEPETGQGVAA